VLERSHYLSHGECRGPVLLAMPVEYAPIPASGAPRVLARICLTTGLTLWPQPVEIDEIASSSERAAPRDSLRLLGLCGSPLSLCVLTAGR